MSNSDLAELLSALGKNEQKRLMVFLETAELGAPVRAESLRMVTYIIDHLGDPEDSPAFSKDTVYQYIFPGKVFVANKLEKTMSDTLQMVKKFVASETAGQNMTTLQQAYYLQKFYNERNLEKKFQQSRKQMEKLRTSNQEWSPQDYHFQFLSEVEETFFQNARNEKKDDLNLWNAIQTLDEYYLLERLKYTCILLNQNQLAPLALPPLAQWLPVDLNAAGLRWFFEKPLGQLFASALELLRNEPEQHEQKLRDFIELLLKHENRIWSDYLSTFEVFACNYGIRRLNKGLTAYAAPVFQLQQRRVDSGRIFQQNQISAAEFQSIATLGLRLGSYEWVLPFLENNRTKIRGSMDSEAYYQFNLAQYQYYTTDYQPALKTLLTTAYEDMQYKLSSKILEIKILWEMSRRDQSDTRVAEFLENKIEAAIIYFFREKKLPDDKKKICKRFADTMKRIIHAEGKRDVKRLQIILEDIAKAEYIAERQWLSKLVEGLIAPFAKK